MLLRLDPHDGTPLFAQFADALRLAVVRGDAGPGERLPPARELATSLEINVHTVLRAVATGATRLGLSAPAVTALPVAAPFVLLLSAALVIRSWTPRLPSPDAVHRGLHGMERTAPSLAGTTAVALGSTVR